MKTRLTILLMMLTLPIMAHAFDSLDKMSDNDPVKLIKSYQMTDEFHLNVTNEEEMARLWGILNKMAPKNVAEVRSEVEKRHQKNAAIVSFRRSLKGKDGSKKLLKNLAEAVGEDQVEKAVGVIAQAEKEEAFYPKYVSALTDLEKSIVEKIENKPFPDGKLLSLSYFHTSPMIPQREVLELNKDKEGRYVLKMTDPMKKGVETMDDKSIMKTFLSDATVEKVRRLMKEKRMQAVPEDQSVFPMIVHDAGSFTFIAHFEGGEIRTSGMGSMSGASSLKKLLNRQLIIMPEGSVTELSYEHYGNRMPTLDLFYYIKVEKGKTVMVARDMDAHKKYEDYDPMKKYTVTIPLKKEELARIREIIEQNEMYRYDSSYSLPKSFGRVLDGDRWEFSFSIGKKVFATQGRNVTPEGNGLSLLLSYLGEIAKKGQKK